MSQTNCPLIQRAWFFKACLMATLLAGILSGDAAAQGSGDMRKLKREIKVMANIIDDVLVDSRNVLVPSSHSVRGVYLPEFGVLFSTEASLLTYGWELGHRPWRVLDLAHDDSPIIEIRKHSKHSGDDVDKRGKTKVEKRKEKIEDREARLYEQAKDELIDALLDYGDTLEALNDNQWVGISVTLKDSDLFGDKGISTWIVKARVGDLRAQGGKGGSRESMMRILEQTEY